MGNIANYFFCQCICPVSLLRRLPQFSLHRIEILIQSIKFAAFNRRQFIFEIPFTDMDRRDLKLPYRHKDIIISMPNDSDNNQNTDNNDHSQKTDVKYSNMGKIYIEIRYNAHASGSSIRHYDAQFFK